jgi:hypothetical protein
MLVCVCSNCCSATDDRTTREIGVVNYDNTLPWEMTMGCNASTIDLMVLFIQGHVDFSSIHYIKEKHISI